MFRRFIPATAAAALLVGGLAGCSVSHTAGNACTPQLVAGSSSNSVVVLGAFGETPQVTPVEGPLETQRTIVTEAADRSVIVHEGDTATVDIQLLDAATGEVLFENPGMSGAGSHQFFSVTETQSSPITEAIRCAAPGERIVLTVDQQLAEQFGLTVGSPAIAVIDVIETRAQRADGLARGLPNGYPAVVTNDQGWPGVVLPPTNAPAGTTSAVRVKGDGDIVDAADAVQVQALGVGWDGNVRVNTWESGVAATLGPDEGADPLRVELTGVPVGSQVVVVTDASGSPEVYVLDIVAAG